VWLGLVVACSACTGILGLESDVPYAASGQLAFSKCGAVKSPLLCDDAPSPAAWPQESRADGGPCTSATVPGKSGNNALRVSCPPTTNANGPGPAWCAIRTVNVDGHGLRALIRFRVEAPPSIRPFGLLAFYLPNGALFVIELAPNGIVEHPFSATDELRLTDNSLGPLDANWHEVEVDIAPSGQSSVLFDHVAKGSVAQLGPIGSGPTDFVVLDPILANVTTAVTVDDVVIVPY
jgi:hypothetical protein